MRAPGAVFCMVVLGGAAFSCGSSSNDNGSGGSSGGGMNGGGGAGGQTGESCHDAGALNVASSDSTAYVIDGVSNPNLTLCRGSTYSFVINTPGHPFYIKTVRGAGTSNAYDMGVTNNGTDSGTLVFVVPADAPSTLFYNCSIHAAMTGTIHVMDGG